MFSWGIQNSSIRSFNSTQVFVRFALSNCPQERAFPKRYPVAKGILNDSDNWLLLRNRLSIVNIQLLISLEMSPEKLYGLGSFNDTCRPVVSIVGNKLIGPPMP
jgi:hypothetical protein